jgi:hypothetical protein
MRERRISQQSRDLNLAIILISTVVMFFLCHLPRWFKFLTCFSLIPLKTADLWRVFMKRPTSTPSWTVERKDWIKLHCGSCMSLLLYSCLWWVLLWFMFVTAAVQLLMVSVIMVLVCHCLYTAAYGEYYYGSCMSLFIYSCLWWVLLWFMYVTAAVQLLMVSVIIVHVCHFICTAAYGKY